MTVYEKMAIGKDVIESYATDHKDFAYVPDSFYRGMHTACCNAMNDLTIEAAQCETL